MARDSDGTYTFRLFEGDKAWGTLEMKDGKGVITSMNSGDTDPRNDDDK
jgi:hypothetical protein